MASTQTPSPIRIFIDSNVLVAASISNKGAGRQRIDYALAGQVDAYISNYVLEETERNILENKPTAILKFHEYRDILSSRIVIPSPEFIEEVLKTVEGKDVLIVAAAIEAKAVYLATYDERHLLRERLHIWENFGVTVLTPLEIIHSLPTW